MTVYHHTQHLGRQYTITMLSLRYNLVTAILLAVSSYTTIVSCNKVHSTVQELTEANFDSALEDPANSLWFLKFYAPWCGHCKKLEPILDKAAPKTKGKMAIGKIDCTKHKDLCKKHKVKGFPTLKFYRDDYYGDYTGDRDEKSLVSFATKMNKNAIIPIKSYDDAIELAKSHADNVAFIAYDSNAKGNNLDDILLSTTALQVYHKVARQQQAYDVFGLIMPGVSNEEIQKMDVGSQTDKFVAKIEAGVETKPYRGEITAAEVLKFIQENNVGIITQISSHNFKSMSSKGRPLALAVVDPDKEDESNAYVEKLKNFVKHGIPSLTSKYYFCTVDGKRWKKFLSQFGIIDTNLPDFFVLDTTKKIYWTDEEQDFQKFLHDINMGKIASKKTSNEW